MPFARKVMGNLVYLERILRRTIFFEKYQSNICTKAKDLCEHLDIALQ